MYSVKVRSAAASPNSKIADPDHFEPDGIDCEDDIISCHLSSRGLEDDIGICLTYSFNDSLATWRKHQYNY